MRMGGRDADDEGAEVVLAADDDDLDALELALELGLALGLALDSLLWDVLLASDLEAAFDDEGSALPSWPMAGTTKASRRTAGFGICMSGRCM